jgi:hypothetical protein
MVITYPMLFNSLPVVFLIWHLLSFALRLANEHLPHPQAFSRTESVLRARVFSRLHFPHTVFYPPIAF